MTGGENHEIEGVDYVIGPQLENKKGSCEFGHLLGEPPFSNILGIFLPAPATQPGKRR